MAGAVQAQFAIGRLGCLSMPERLLIGWRGARGRVSHPCAPEAEAAWCGHGAGQAGGSGRVGGGTGALVPGAARLPEPHRAAARVPQAHAEAPQVHQERSGGGGAGEGPGHGGGVVRCPTLRFSVSPSRRGSLAATKQKQVRRGVKEVQKFINKGEKG